MRLIILSCVKGEGKEKIVLHSIFGEYLPNFLPILSCILACVCKHVASSLRKVILPLTLTHLEYCLYEAPVQERHRCAGVSPTDGHEDGWELNYMMFKETGFLQP